jgi:hypothetical protein
MCCPPVPPAFSDEKGYANLPEKSRIKPGCMSEEAIPDKPE